MTAPVRNKFSAAVFEMGSASAQHLSYLNLVIICVLIIMSMKAAAQTMVFFVKVCFILPDIYRLHVHRHSAVWLCLCVSTGHLSDSAVPSTRCWCKIEPEKWRISLAYSSLAQLMVCTQGIWGIETVDHALVAGVKEKQNVIDGRNEESRGIWCWYFWDIHWLLTLGAALVALCLLLCFFLSW